MNYPGIRSTILEAVDRTGGNLRVLDVGCGTGKWLAELASAGCNVAGIDPSEEMLRRAFANVRGDLRRGSAEALPWGNAWFDVVLYINSFHHVAAPETALRETFRVLRPGGYSFPLGWILTREPAAGTCTSSFPPLLPWISDDSLRVLAVSIGSRLGLHGCGGPGRRAPAVLDVFRGGLPKWHPRAVIYLAADGPLAAGLRGRSAANPSRRREGRRVPS